MSYSTPAMVRQALVPSSDGTQPTGSNLTHTAADLSDAQLQDSINEADAMIDGYIGGVYTTPVAQVAGLTPHPIDYLSRNIAAYNATLAFRGSMDFTDTDPVARRYRDSEAFLKGVGTNRISLPIPRNVGGAGATTSVAPAFNPYTGDLWTPDDFSIRPANRSTYPWAFNPAWADPSDF